MKNLLRFVLLITLAVIQVQAQSSASRVRTPKDIVQKYWEFEIEGGRLTAEGWNKANAFFVRASARPKTLVIFVVRGDYAVWDPIVNGAVIRENSTEWERSVKGSTALVGVGLEGILGEVDSSTLRFKPHVTDAIKEGAAFNLILTDRHWDLEPNGVTPKEVTGPLEWKIDTPDNNSRLNSRIWLNKYSAIRYVTKVRDATTDLVVKKNANETLSILGRSR